MKNRLGFLLIVLAAETPFPLDSAAGRQPDPQFHPQDVDTKVEIGYGVALGDVDGDRRPDLLLVDKKQIAWYHNPEWQRYLIVENLTKQDNVCIAARDLDGDGKVEIAVGAEWNPGDTVTSGSVHYLIPPPDRRTPWQPVELPHEPTVHRMRWALNASGAYDLMVLPLHGRGNKNGEGAGAQVLSYALPSDPRGPWKTELVDGSMHVTHNLEPVEWDQDPEQELLIAGREGVMICDRGPDGWSKTLLAGPEKQIAPEQQDFKGASEIRAGRLPAGKRFLAAIEPFHGNQVVAYMPPAAGKKLWARRALDSSLNGGHAIACADFLGLGSDQIAAGWRLKNQEGKVGINLYIPLDGEGRSWKTAPIDANQMACEDMAAGDLDGDGRVDLVASGRDSHNLKIYWNRLGGPRYPDHSKLLVARDREGHETPVCSPGVWSVRREHILQGLEEVMGPVRRRIQETREKKWPLDLQVEEEKKLGGYTLKRISFIGEPGDRVPAFLLVPLELKGKVPGLLCLHQTVPIGKAEPAGLGGKESLHYARHLAERGFVTLAPDYPNFGDHAFDTYGKDYLSGTMKAICDNARALDLIQSLPEVDPERLGCIGHSLGGHNTLFTAVFDERIKALVSNCGYNAFQHYYGGDLKGWSSKTYMPRLASYGGWRGVPFDFHEVVAALAPRAFLSISPRRDANFAVEGVREVEKSAREVYRLLGAAESFQVLYPDCEHDFPPEMREKAYAWLEKLAKN